MFDQALPLITQFGTDIQGGVVDLIGVIIPVGLALWGIGFGVKKGLSFLQKKASKAI